MCGLAFPTARGGRLPGKAGLSEQGAGQGGWMESGSDGAQSGNGCLGMAVGLGRVTGRVGVRMKVSVLEYRTGF